MIVAYSKWCAKTMISERLECQNLLTIFLEFFPCNLMRGLYNVDIREKKKKKEKENENGND
jgi:hypothetical protein